MRKLRGRSTGRAGDAVRKVGFEALIKEVKAVSLVSGDKGARVILQIDNPSDSLMDNLNRLHRPDRFVGVAIAEKK